MNINTIERQHTETPVEPAKPEVLPTVREDVTLEECSPGDPELKELVEANRDGIAQGSININAISELKPPYGWAYKIFLHEEDQSDPTLVGAVYAIRKGMDYGSIQIAYFIDEDHQKQGIAGAAVETATDQLAEKYDIVANISPENEPSSKLVRKLGYMALDEANGMDVYVKPRQRTPNHKSAA